MTVKFKDSHMQAVYARCMKHGPKWGGFASAFERGRMFARGDFKRVPYLRDSLAYAAFAAGRDSEREEGKKVLACTYCGRPIRKGTWANYIHTGYEQDAVHAKCAKEMGL